MKGTHKAAGGSDSLAKINALRAGYKIQKDSKAIHAVGAEVTEKVAGHIGEKSGNNVPAGSAPVLGIPDTGIDISKKRPQISSATRENLVPKKSHIVLGNASGKDMRLVFDHFSQMETQSGKKGTVWKDVETGGQYYWDYNVSKNKIRLHEKVLGNGYKPNPQEYLLIEIVI